MKRKPTPKPVSRPAAASKPQNRHVNLQTRKVLAKHYRAKHGVK